MLEPQLALTITIEMCYFNLLSPGERNNSFESSARTYRLVENFLSNLNLQWIPDPSWQQIRYMKIQYHYFQGSFHMFAKFRREPLVQFLVFISKNDKFYIHIMVPIKYFYWISGSKVGGRDIQCWSSKKHWRKGSFLQWGWAFSIRKLDRESAWTGGSYLDWKAQDCSVRRKRHTVLPPIQVSP